MIISDKNPPLLEALAKAYYLFLDGATVQIGSASGKTFAYRENDFVAIDPRLDGVLDLMLNHRRKVEHNPHVNWLPCSTFFATIDYLLNPKYFQDVDGHVIAYNRLDSIESYTPGRTAVQIEVDSYCIKLGMTRNNVPVGFVERLEYATFPVATAWLNETHPGWEARLVTGEALGYAKGELASFVFDAPRALPAVTLDGIDFHN